MGFLKKLDPSKPGITPKVVGAVEVGSASFLFGYLQNRYRERAQVLGVPVDLLTGVVGKLAVIIGGEHYGVLSGVMPHLDNVANAGLGSYLHTVGSSLGARAAGMSRALIPASQKSAVAKLPGATLLGAAKAPKGDFLTPAELAELAR